MGGRVDDAEVGVERSADDPGRPLRDLESLKAKLDAALRVREDRVAAVRRHELSLRSARTAVTDAAAELARAKARLEAVESRARKSAREAELAGAVAELRKLLAEAAALSVRELELEDAYSRAKDTHASELTLARLAAELSGVRSKILGDAALEEASDRADRLEVELAELRSAPIPIEGDDGEEIG